ncbi:MAG: exo-alpha-sialidase [Planctomycetota bacterium]|jgi:predicted neuraminidase|nr:exo-alpha-sialidase [Planctomycetota bacterium]
MKQFILVAGFIVLVLAVPSAWSLEPLPYNHPGLTVDLGVGLWAWPLPCDADGDGDFDLVVSCPDKPSNGIYLFENTYGDTAKTKFPVFKPAHRIAATTHYVMPSYVFGQMRVLTPGIEHRNFLTRGLADKVKLPVAATFHKPTGTQPKGPKVRHNQWRYVDYDGDEDLDLVVGIEDWSHYGWDDGWNEKGEWIHGPLHGWVYLVRNTGTAAEPTFAEPEFIEAGGKRLDVFGCSSPNFEDFDGDGDMDLLCGEFLDSFTYFENVGSRSVPRYAAGRRVTDAAGKVVSMELQMIVPIAFDWDNDGDFDLIVGDEDGRVALVENTGSLSTEGTPIFVQPKYFQQEADTLKCGALATPVGVDWDGDGDQDIVSGNTAGFIEWFENLSGPEVTRPKWAAPRRLEAGGSVFRVMAGNRSIQGPAEAKWGYTTLSVADWDGDSLPDIVLNSITGQVQWLKNVGTRREPKLALPQPVEVEWDGPRPTLAWGWLRPSGKGLLTQWRTTPCVHDFDGDGLVDLAMLDTEGRLAFFRRSIRDGVLVLEHPRWAFSDEAGQPLRLNAGTAGRSGRRKLCVTDWDGDGRFDLLLNSANADFFRQVGMQGDTWVMKNSGVLSPKNIEGHDVSPAVVDFDGNGIPDFLGGAEDGRFYYLANPRAADRVKNAAVVCAEFVYEVGPYPQIHASTIAETPAGLVAAWFGGTREKHPDVSIWVSRFVSGTWTPSREVANGIQADGTRHPTWNPVLFQPSRGPLMLFYKVGPSPQEWWGELKASTDHGLTWSPARRLPAGIFGPIKNKPVEFPDGSIICPSSTETHENPSKWSVHFERTGDLGATWQKIGPVNDGVMIQSIQPSILFLGGDRLVALGRSRQNRMFEIMSDDGGVTWGRMTLGSLPNNNSGTDAVTLADGSHLLVYNHVAGSPGQWGGKRTPLNVAASRDGTTWEAALVLEDDPGEYSYPAIIQTSDGLVHVTYTWNRRKVKHVVIDPKRLRPEPMPNCAWPTGGSAR